MTPEEQSRILEAVVAYAKLGMKLQKEGHLTIDRRLIEPFDLYHDGLLEEALRTVAVQERVLVQVKFHGQYYHIAWTPTRTIAQVEEAQLRKSLPW